MISLYSLKSRFQSLLRPCVGLLAKKGIKPNSITLLSCILSIWSGVLCWNGASFLILPAVFLFRMALNAIDGMLAREHRMVTPLGGLLNEVADVISDVALYFSFMRVPQIRPEWMALLLSVSVIAEMTGVLIVTLGGKRRYDGPMGKSDRAFVFGAAGLVLGLGVSPGPWMNWLIIGTLFLLVLTIWNRGYQGLRSLRV